MKKPIQWLGCLILLVGCHAYAPETDLSKVKFDVHALNEKGLAGTHGNYHAVDYAFCIPAYPMLAEQIKQIDPSITIFEGSPGRIACTENQYFCAGNTHQKNYDKVLQKLSSISYIREIRKVDWE